MLVSIEMFVVPPTDSTVAETSPLVIHRIINPTFEILPLSVFFALLPVPTVAGLQWPIYHGGRGV